MSDTPDIAPQPPTRPRRRIGRALIGLGTVLLLTALVGAGIALLFWAAGTVGGTAWVLARLSSAGIGVEVIEPDGVLLGDLRARQVIVTQGGTRIVIDRPQWRNLRASYTPYPETWLALTVDALSAERVTITVTPKPGDTGDGKPATLPQRLRMPLELHIADLRAAEVHVPGLEGRPLRDVQGRLELGGEQGRLHQLDRFSARLDPLLITGQASLGADAPMTLKADLQAVQSGSAPAERVLPSWAKTLQPDWRAQLKVQGPLARFEAQAQVRAQGQSLDADALIAPVEPWPLPRLQATTENLDLSALLEKAPLTALSGQVQITPTGTPTEHALTAVVRLTNAKPGRWDLQQLPLRSLSLDLRARTGQARRLELSQAELLLSDGRRDAGTLKAKGHWDGGDIRLDAELAQLQPSLIDPRLAAMSLSGPIKLTAQRVPQAADARTWPRFDALVELKGRLEQPDRPVQLRLEAKGTEDTIDLKELRASTGETHATLKGQADRNGESWQIKAKASMADFDPRPWFPAGLGAGWQAGVYRLNLNGDAALTLPDSVWASKMTTSWPQHLAGLRGTASADLKDTQLAGLPITGTVSLGHAGARDPFQTKAELDLGGNRIRVDGQIAPDAQGQADHWTAEANAPAIGKLAPLLRLLLTPEQAASLLEGLGGALEANAQMSGRWPAVSTQGKAALANVRAGAWSVGQADLRWEAGTALNAPLDVLLNVAQAAWDKRQLGPSSLALKGTPAAHELSLRGELKAAPPVWMENLQARPRPAVKPPGTPAARPPATPASAAPLPTTPAAPPPSRTLVVLNVRGGVSGSLFSPAGSGKAEPPPFAWQGTVQQLELRTTDSSAVPLLAVKDVGIDYVGGNVPRLAVSEGRAEIVGAGMRWNRLEWQADHGVRTQQLDMHAELEPLAVAPLLQRAQPNFGWGGDLEIAGKVVIRQTDDFSADIVLERTRGDLTVTEESGTQSLGLSDLRIGLNAQNGVWNFTAGLAGQQLGVLGGALVVRTSPKLAWPAADAPIQGVIEAQVANLGTWGAWVPAGWRLDGKLNLSASFGGRVNAPEYTGQVRGSGLGVRNIVEGVSLTDGEVDVALRGDTARINKFTARGGGGTVRLEGDARLDDKWRAQLKLVADKFQMLGRVDLRIITSGEAELLLSEGSAKAKGKFVVDEGLVDFTRLSSPSLGDDVIVVGRSDREEAPPNPGAPGLMKLDLNLVVNAGNELRMRGLGLDTKLRGELEVSLPNGKWALQGKVNAVDGTFANYGQKLVIDRGIVSFNGAPSDMRLDIEATRPNVDVRVGVQVTGPLANLRVRLFSEPVMSTNDMLSWLLLGHASEGLGRSDAAMVQRAAFALLAGEDEGKGGPGAITKALGIDDVSVRPGDSENKDTVVSVGKQLSKRVYLAYEQNLNTSTGSVQVTYRIAQRFVMRLQSGLDRSVDFIGTWRWE
ncbi:MAG TPA: translocation/assembly module TamB domain-containing protein [Rhizobacter sp.]|nr:translocation/assembly module TamB domain-containing protein [Rhizobacter sp.]